MNSGNTGDPSGFVLAELLTCCSQQDRLVRGMRGMLRLWAALDWEHCCCLRDRLWPYGSCSVVVFVPCFGRSWGRERGRLRRQLQCGESFRPDVLAWKHKCHLQGTPGSVDVTPRPCGNCWASPSPFEWQRAPIEGSQFLPQPRTPSERCRVPEQLLDPVQPQNTLYWSRDAAVHPAPH